MSKHQPFHQISLTRIQFPVHFPPHLKHFFFGYPKRIFQTKNIPGRAHLVVFHWFYKGWSHFGPLFKPFWPNMSGATMKWMHVEVLFSQFTSFSIGSTIESVQSDLSFCSEIAFQQGFIRFIDKTKGRFYANYWIPIGFTMNSVHPHVMFYRESRFSNVL